MKRILGAFLVLSVLANIVLLVRFDNRNKPVASSTRPSEIKRSKKEMITSSPKTGTVVFLGTSLTEGFRVRDFISTPSIRNFGISGATIDDLLEIYPSVITKDVLDVRIEIGINDIKSTSWSDSLFKKDFKDLIDGIRNMSHPSCRVFIQSILPVNSKYFGDRTSFINEQVIHVNDFLEDFCAGHQPFIQYIDLHPHFFNGAELNPELTYDGLHLNSKGYLIWLGLLPKPTS